MSQPIELKSEPNDVDMLNSTPINSDGLMPESDSLMPEETTFIGSQPSEEKSQEDDEEAKPAVKHDDKENPEDIKCKWVGCDERDQSTPAALVRHLNYNHLSYTNSLSINNPIRYTCLWEGCPRYGTDQPSRFALISHCRTHTGEKPYFCPIPECEKHFTRSDALAKHVKGVHDLHVLKDAVLLNKDRIKKGRMEPSFEGQENMSESEFVALIEQDYSIRNPWWFSDHFLDVLSDPKSDIDSLQKIPLDTKQYRVAKARYESYIKSPDQELGITDETLDQELKQNVFELSAFVKNSKSQEYDFDQMDMASLQTAHEFLQSNLTTANRVNKIASTQLAESVKLKRKLWVMNQILIDANASLSIPPGETKQVSTSTTITNGDKDDRVHHKDKIDDEIFSSISSF